MVVFDIFDSWQLLSNMTMLGWQVLNPHPSCSFAHHFSHQVSVSVVMKRLVGATQGPSFCRGDWHSDDKAKN